MKVFAITHFYSQGHDSAHHGVILGGDLESAERVAKLLTKDAASDCFDEEDFVESFRDAIIDQGVEPVVAATLFPTVAAVKAARQEAIQEASHREYFRAHETKILS